MGIARTHVFYDRTLPTTIDIPFISVADGIVAGGWTAEIIHANGALTVASISARLVSQTPWAERASTIDDHFITVQSSVLTRDTASILALL